MPTGSRRDRVVLFAFLGWAALVSAFYLAGGAKHFLGSLAARWAAL